MPDIEESTMTSERLSEERVWDVIFLKWILHIPHRIKQSNTSVMASNECLIQIRQPNSTVLNVNQTKY